VSAKLLPLTVLSPAGDVLGTYGALVTNTLWRARKERPRFYVFRGMREAEPYGDGWAFRLREGEKPPRQRT